MHLVRGVKHKQGNYQGNDYDNMYVHCLADNEGDMVCGDPVEILKIKTPVFMNIVKRLGLTPIALVNQSIRVFYDRNGQVSDFEVIKK